MNYRGRTIDVIALWGQYCDRLAADEGEFLPLTYCPNPSHDNTRSPAFQINQRRPLVHCFSGCGISGTYEHAVALIEGLYEKFPDDNQGRRRAQREARKIILRHSRLSAKGVSSDALQKRGRRSGRAIPDAAAKQRRSLEDELQRFSYLPPLATSYLNGRGISSRAITAYGIGFDPGERRVVIPARDERGRVIGLIRRAIRPQDHPKYLYTEGFDRNTLLFGACVIDPGLVRSEGLIVVEGSMDALRLYEAGLHNVVSILGSSVSRQHAEIIARLRPKRVYLMFDKDPAGIGAISSAKVRLRKFPLFVCRYPKGKSDPAELSREEAYRSVSRAVPMVKFAKHLPESRRELYVG